MQMMNELLLVLLANVSDEEYSVLRTGGTNATGRPDYSESTWGRLDIVWTHFVAHVFLFSMLE